MHSLLILFSCSRPLPAPVVPPPLPDTGWQVIGQSLQGRDIRLRTVGHGPRTVLWIGGIHGDEIEGAHATAQLPEAFLTDPERAERVTLHLIEDLNPDGRAAQTRGNAAEVDLNRNYPAAFEPAPSHGAAPLDQPEAALLAAQLDALSPAVVLVAHSWREKHFINYDGPAADLAERFSARSGYPVVVSDSIAPTPGSLGSWVGRTQGVPILTVEYERGHDAIACWQETEAAILAVIDLSAP
ncbi:MAG: protein MpaA [Myxococcota bacterium]|jgi:protein MpaA